MSSNPARLLNSYQVVLTLPVSLSRLAKWVPACWVYCVGVATRPGLCPIAKETASAAPTLCTEYGPHGWMDWNDHLWKWKTLLGPGHCLGELQPSLGEERLSLMGAHWLCVCGGRRNVRYEGGPICPSSKISNQCRMPDCVECPRYVQLDNPNVVWNLEIPAISVRGATSMSIFVTATHMQNLVEIGQALFFSMIFRCPADVTPSLTSIWEMAHTLMNHSAYKTPWWQFIAGSRFKPRRDNSAQACVPLGYPAMMWRFIAVTQLKIFFTHCNRIIYFAFLPPVSNHEITIEAWRARAKWLHEALHKMVEYTFKNETLNFVLYIFMPK